MEKPTWKIDPFNTWRFEGRDAWLNGVKGTIIDTYFKTVLFYSPETQDHPLYREWLMFDDPALAWQTP